MSIENLCDFGGIVSATDNTNLLKLPSSYIKDLFKDYHLLVFRGFDSLPLEEMVNFSERFGSLLKWDFGYVFDLQIQENPTNHIFREGRLELHWDGSYLGPEKTPRYSFFQCAEGNDSEGGETIFCDAIKAYEDSEEEFKNSLKRANITYETERKAHFGGTLSWPLVCPIAGDGRSVIRYMEAFNEDNEDINPIDVSVDGMERADSDVFLRQLNTHLYNSKYLYEHRWTKGEFLMFNNNALLHGRNSFQSASDKRRIQRVHIL
jgi:alpha-ketoglutarate-dependent taurine dioxygenase